ncbi:DUF5060 domain-containing protein [uncultured Algibacter sp.]|uniref:DUF5060 domain-containing protein n=1 Tax=uncultured Algibacter sp. TaxID=298659 RepID=UPI003216874A
MTKLTPLTRYVLLTLICIALSISGYSQTVNVSGETPLKKWDKISISLTLANTISESNTSFKNNRMDVIFTAPSGSTIRVPGFFAADGDAANSNATSGTIFKAYLRPNQIGAWTYQVLFYTGSDVALQNIDQLPAPIHNLSGNIGSVSPSNATLPDFKAKGRLQYQTTGTNNQRRYLKWAETGEHFLKFGPDSPENILDYDDFDHDENKKNCGLCTEHSFNPHADDWKTGDPTWDGGKGKNLIGAVNYLKNQQMNSMSMSLFGGDDKNVFPWTTINNKFQFDVSKLEQWEIVFDHAEKNGLMLHLKLAEAENWNALSLDEIKVYYREMVARFGHHLALEWNISEEFGGKDGTDPANAIPRIDWLASIDPWQNHRVLHTYPNSHETYYNYLISNNAKITGASIQSSQKQGYNDAYNGKSGIKTWIDNSRDGGIPWVVASDEQNPGSTGVFISPAISVHDVRPQARKRILWKGLLAGGAGVMWYGGSEGDFQTENFNRFSILFQWTKIAILQFFEGHGLEYWKMENNDTLATGGNNVCLAEEGETYVIYLENGGTTNLNLSGQSGNFDVKWFNPRDGGALQDGSTTSIVGGANINIGNPPSNNNSDWVVLVTKSGKPNVAATSVSMNPSAATIEEGEKFSLITTFTPDTTTNRIISWTTSDASVATVDTNGIITAIAEGQATIIGTTQDGGFTGSSVITVTAAPIIDLGCPFVEEDGLLVIEVENAKNFNDAMFTLETGPVGTTSPTGVGYLRYNGANNLSVQVPDNTIGYKVKINNPGVYQFLWRNVRDPQAATADAANDSWLYIKDNNARFYGIKDGTEYTLTGHTKVWVQQSNFVFQCFGETNSGGNHINGMSMWVDFPAAGEYTIEYGGRSKGHSVDRLMLFKTDQTAAAKNVNTPESAREGTDCETQTCSNLDLNAVDFPITQVTGFEQAYVDNARNAMAINAAQHKDKFAAVKQSFTGADGTYNITLTTLAELDGESTYRLKVDGVLIGTYQNPETTVDYTPTTKTWTDVSIKNGDDIQVEFNSHTNGKIPEGSGTAFSRGRWTKLAFICDGAPPLTEVVAFSNLPIAFKNDTTTFPIDVVYTANEERDLNVTINSPTDVFIAEQTITVTPGPNQRATVNVTVPTALAIDENYKFVLTLRTVGGNASTNIDEKEKLVNIVDIILTDDVGLSKAPTAVTPSTSYSVDVDYTASAERQVVIALYKGRVWQKSDKVTVATGSGTVTLTITLTAETVIGDDYSWRAHIRPVGASGNDATARTRVNFAVNSSLSTNDEILNKKGIIVYPNPMGDEGLTVKLKNIVSTVSYSILDINGRIIKSGSSDNQVFTIPANTIQSKGVYILKIKSNDQEFTQKIVK